MPTQTRGSRFPNSVPTAVTATQRERIVAEADAESAAGRPTSISDVVRAAIDARYGLVNGEEATS